MSAALTTLEKDWQRDVIRLARTLGWKVAHFRPAQTSKGWRTAVAADGAGFPDLVLVSPIRKRVVFLELKRERGKVSDRQAEWIRDLHAAGAEVYVARPRHLEALAYVLGAVTHGTPAYHQARQLLLLELDTLLEAA